jgi:hypothetical protein
MPEADLHRSDRAHSQAHIPAPSARPFSDCAEKGFTSFTACANKSVQRYTWGNRSDWSPRFLGANTLSAQSERVGALAPG